MAMIAIPISEDVGRLFRQVDVPGERDPSDHLTLFYLGKDIKLDHILLATRAVYRVASNMEPFTVSCKRIVSLPKGENGYPVVAKVDSKGIEPLWKAIEKELTRSGVRYDKAFVDDMVPHVTLSFSKKKVKNISFPKIEWQVNSVSLFGGDGGDERIFVTFPFSLGISKKAGYIAALADLFENVSGYEMIKRAQSTYASTDDAELRRRYYSYDQLLKTDPNNPKAGQWQTELQAVRYEMERRRINRTMKTPGYTDVNTMSDPQIKDELATLVSSIENNQHNMVMWWSRRRELEAMLALREGRLTDQRVAQK